MPRRNNAPKPARRPDRITLRVEALESRLVPATANPDVFSVTANQTRTVAAPGVLSNDSEQTGSVFRVQNVSNGTLSLAVNGGFTYTPNTGFVGTDTFTYFFFGSIDSSNTTTVTLEVTGGGGSGLPVAVADTFTVTPGQPLVVPAPGVLANDTAPGGGSLFASVVSNPSLGTLSLQSSGNFTYTPSSSFTTSDSFTYVANGSGGTSSPATVSLVRNRPPVATDDSFTVSLDSNGAALLNPPAPGILGNDSDPDGDTLTAQVTTAAANGTVSVLSDGSFFYSPRLGFSGADSFVYTISDGKGGAATATVRLTVNLGVSVIEAPVNLGNDRFAVVGNTAVSITGQGVLRNDVTSFVPSVRLLAAPGHGTVTLNVDGTFVYKPTPGFVGQDTFTYAITSSDGRSAAAARVVIDVLPPATPPVVEGTKSDAGRSVPTDETDFITNGPAARAGFSPTVGAFDPATGTWYLRNATAPGAPDTRPFAFGGAGWIPLLGDWDGNGTVTIGVFDPGTATFYLRNANTGGPPDVRPFAFGAPGWAPVVGDWNGDGKTTIGVFDPGTGTFYLRNANTGGPPEVTPFAFGAPGWAPVAGDWNGDGKTTIGVYDPGTATFYLRNANTGGPPAITPFAFGAPAWKPLAGDWDGDGVTTVGTMNPDAGRWYLRNRNDGGPPVGGRFRFGAGAWTPVGGRWQQQGALSLAQLAESQGPGAPPLDPADLAAVVAAARVQLVGQGAAAKVIDAVPFRVADLTAALLGLSTDGGIWIDADAAGHGWFAGAASAAVPAERQDLLTVVLHELGHALGLPDIDAADHPADVMGDTLATGVRLTDFIDAAFGNRS